ncbi:hypothetical protein DKX38_012810 [Salix brachista]|uniref:Uncharacterized protein n=1 Tax=Salix brachista TaxID=2182728 RepID=A0A5N5LQ30_9ROSI|nr:hypothetical protein DKX38_012810 [Salix brachista]
MGKDTAECRWASIKTLFASCISASSSAGKNTENERAAPPAGPEKTMVTAAKHFSSAHKASNIFHLSLASAQNVAYTLQSSPDPMRSNRFPLQAMSSS